MEWANGADGCVENELIKCVCVIKLYVKCVDNVAVNVNGNALPRRWRPSSASSPNHPGSEHPNNQTSQQPNNPTIQFAHPHSCQWVVTYRAHWLPSFAKCDFNDSNKGEHLSEIYYLAVSVRVCVCVFLLHLSYIQGLHLLPRIWIHFDPRSASISPTDPTSPGRISLLWQLSQSHLPFDEINLMPCHLCKLR